MTTEETTLYVAGTMVGIVVALLCVLVAYETSMRVFRGDRGAALSATLVFSGGLGAIALCVAVGAFFA